MRTLVATLLGGISIHAQPTIISKEVKISDQVFASARISLEIMVGGIKETEYMRRSRRYKPFRNP